jgi:hypothetical protein
MKTMTFIVLAVLAIVLLLWFAAILIDDLPRGGRVY